MNSNGSWANWRHTCVFAVLNQSVDKCAFSQSVEEAKVAQRRYTQHGWKTSFVVGHVFCVQFSIALSVFCFHMIPLVILCLALFFWFLNVHVFH